MSHRVHTDHLPVVQNFRDWVQRTKVKPVFDSETPASGEFLPERDVALFFGDTAKITALLEAALPDVLVHASEVSLRCAKVFAILLLIGYPEFIKHFLSHANLSDSHLPLLECPNNFPKVDGMFERFQKQQWLLCPHKFEYISFDVVIERDCILPITEKKEIGKGGSSKVYAIKLHEQYDGLSAGSRQVAHIPPRALATVYWP